MGEPAKGDDPHRAEGEPVKGDDQDNTTQLGCGTLILIAVIVAIFSGRSGIDDARTEIRSLHAKVRQLETKIDTLLVQTKPREPGQEQPPGPSITLP